MIWVVLLIAAVAINFAPHDAIDTNCAQSYRALIFIVVGAIIGLSGNPLPAVFFIGVAMLIYNYRRLRQRFR